MARENLERAGLEDLVDLRVGDAASVLRGSEPGEWGRVTHALVPTGAGVLLVVREP
jgi:tRNA A58 N-methylase Trm61